MMGYSTLQKSVEDSTTSLGLGNEDCNKSCENSEASHLAASHDVASVAFAVEELYPSHPQEKTHLLCGNQKQKDMKELHGIVPMDLYCNSLDNSAVEVGQSVNNIPLPNSMMSLMNAASSSSIEYSLIPSFDTSLTNVNSITQLGLSNLFHPSETDSEVALTLASLGDPKNDKLDHSCSLQETFSLAGRDNSSAPADTSTTSMSLTSDANEQNNLLDISNAGAIPEKDYTAPDPEGQGANEAMQGMYGADRAAPCEPTLVLRSRRARGNSSQQQKHHNFPDPERIGRRRRKKYPKNKGSLDCDADQGSLSDVLRKSETNTTNSQVTSTIHIKDETHEDTSIFVHEDQLSQSKNSRNFLNPPDKLYLLEKEFVFSESQLPVLEERNDQKRANNFSKRTSCDDIANLQRVNNRPVKLSTPGAGASDHSAQLNNFTHSSFSTLLDSNDMVPKQMAEQALNQPGNQLVENQSQCSSGLYSLGESSSGAQVVASSVLFSPPCNRNNPQSAQATSSCNSTHGTNFATPPAVSVTSSLCSSQPSNLGSLASPGKNCHGLNSSSGSSVKVGNDNFYALPTSTLTFQEQNYFQPAGSMLPMSSGTQSLSNCTISFLPVSQAPASFSHPAYHPNTSAAPSSHSDPHVLPNSYIGGSESVHHTYDPPSSFTKNFAKSNSISPTTRTGISQGSTEQNTSETGALSTVLLLPVSAAATEKENLLGQLLKASEHCEPASLIPAGVVNDVIPAVGYRILEVSNLSEMIRSMHSCSGSNMAGSIVIQEQASLREGAVSQLSVICTACQEGTVCATSNRVSYGDLHSDATSTAAPAWDINVRVRQLVHEFGLSEQQVQRMLEILGIFYRPCDSPSTSTSSFLYPTSSMASGHAGSDVRQQASSNNRTANATANSSVRSDQLANGVKQAEPVVTSKKNSRDKNVGLKFESLENLSVSGNAPYGKSSSSSGGEGAGPKKRKRAKQATPPVPKPKTLSCSECSAMFASLNHLKKHSLSHNLAQHTCPYCHSYFKKPYNLKEHIKKHQNVKYKCNICDREFTDRSTLTVHHKSSHERKKEFQCSECSRTFYRRIHYTDHMRVHTRERPYACEVCNKRFIWRDSVKKHMETHITAAKYSCRLCGRWFRWLQGIRQHLQQQHKLKKCDVEAQVLSGGASALFQKHTQVQLVQSAQAKQGEPSPLPELPSAQGDMVAGGLTGQDGSQSVQATDGFSKPVAQPFQTEEPDEVKRAVRSIQLSESYSKSLSPKKVERCSTASNALAPTASFDGRDASLTLGCEEIFLVDGLAPTADSAEMREGDSSQVQNHLTEQHPSQCNPQQGDQSMNKPVASYTHAPPANPTASAEWRRPYPAFDSVPLNANPPSRCAHNSENYNMSVDSCESKDAPAPCGAIFSNEAKSAAPLEASQNVHDYITDELRSPSSAS